MNNMAMKCKVLMRPKVRFNEQSESTDNSDMCVGPFNGPRIKSIVSLDKPVRLISSTNEEKSLKNKKPIAIDTINEATNDLSKIKKATIPSSTSVSAPYLGEINTDKINSKGMKCCKLSSKPKNSSSTSRQESALNSNKVASKLSTAPLKHSDTTRKHQLNTKNYVESNKENVSQRSSQSKEQNIKIPSKLSSSSSNKSTKIVDKNKINTGEKVKGQLPSKSSTTSSQLNTLTSIPAKNLLSRIKLPIATIKQQQKPTRKIYPKSQVRSEMLKNISGSIPNVYVGPGISRNRTQSLSSVSEKIQTRTNINPEIKLDRPEYNSIMFTIKKLNEARNERIVTDIDSLPTNYKNLFLKKISSALDFPPGESIYHDLIDLSIAEQELPSRLMRSKDPEPRQKDLEPRLSDFFQPQYEREYSEAVKIIPKNPDIIDNLSAYTISDRIFSWKTCLDEL